MSFNKSLLGATVLISAVANADVDLRNQSTKRITLDHEFLSKLIEENILIPDRSANTYNYNPERAFAVLDEVNDPETVSFLKTLIRVIGSTTAVQIRSVDDMILSTQDHGFSKM